MRADTPQQHGCLAIATPILGKSTETSQRRHIAQLFGGNTVVITKAVEQGFTTDRPVFQMARKPFTPLERAELELGKAWHTIVYRASGVPFGRKRRALEAFLREHRVFAILGEFGHLGSSMAPIGARLGIPVFVYFRGFDASKRLRSPLRVMSYRAALPRLAGYFAVSQSLLDNLAAKGIRHERSMVIPSGVDTRRFAPGAKDPHLLLAVGRIIPKKAVDVTIRAFARVAAAHPGHRLEIVGDGPERPRCEALAAELGLDGRVIFHGFQGHEVVREKLAQAALFVQHSVTDALGNEEGMPIAIQEAMASGAVVVSTRHAGIPEAVTSGVNGILVEEQDLDGFAAALGSLLDDPALATRMAAAARDTAVERFDTERLHARLEAAILAACGR